MTASDEGSAPGRMGDHVSDYVRSERWELAAPPGTEAFPSVAALVPVDAHQTGPGGGLRTGSLLTAVDSLGGLVCGLAVLPRWVVTTSMMATVVRLDHRGPLRLDATVLRRGRTSVVSSVAVVDGGAGDRPVARVTVTCAPLDPGALPLHFDRPFTVPLRPPDPEPSGPEEFFGIVPGTGPVTRLELHPRLRNPWGILHGGAVAVVVDVAACRAAEAAGVTAGAPAASSTTVLDYLHPVRVGPVEARCRVLAGPAGSSLVRVAVHDVGAGDRLCSTAAVTVDAMGGPVGAA
jgi:uncharacterized protein (TIGR00369 family)